MKTLFGLIFCSLLASSVNAGALADKLAEYRSQGVKQVNAEMGEQRWFAVARSVAGKERSCVSCHGKDLTRPGQHVKTGKVIDPIALSVNADRFSDKKKIEKWFKRNCKWTYGRVCSAQEKADFLVFLSKQ